MGYAKVLKINKKRKERKNVDKKCVDTFLVYSRAKKASYTLK